MRALFAYASRSETHLSETESGKFIILCQHLNLNYWIVECFTNHNSHPSVVTLAVQIRVLKTIFKSVVMFIDKKCVNLVENLIN